jgi:hypothetical protein
MIPSDVWRRSSAATASLGAHTHTHAHPHRPCAEHCANAQVAGAATDELGRHRTHDITPALNLSGLSCGHTRVSPPHTPTHPHTHTHTHPPPPHTHTRAHTAHRAPPQGEAFIHSLVRPAHHWGGAAHTACLLARGSRRALRGARSARERGQARGASTGAHSNTGRGPRASTRDASKCVALRQGWEEDGVCAHARVALACSAPKTKRA